MPLVKFPIYRNIFLATLFARFHAAMHRIMAFWSRGDYPWACWKD